MSHACKSDPDRLSTLQQRLEAVKREIRRAKSEQKQQARRDDARRKIIAGALALEHLEQNPSSEFGKLLFRLLDEYTRLDDRRLFDFLPVRDPSPTPGSASVEAAE